MSLTRHTLNPILTRLDIPAVRPHLVDVTSVLNPGATVYRDRPLLLLRVQNRGRETFLMAAESGDGARFTVRDREIRWRGLERVPGTIHHIYDPRITRLGDEYLVTVAMDIDETCRIGLARTGDFETLEFLGLACADDSRNGVLFPERIGGRYAMLERPNSLHAPDGPPTGDAIVLSFSDDLRRWQRAGVVMHGRPHLWDERIGPGPPPVKTREGWLLVYHGVATHFGSASIYQAGAALLALDDPTRVIARGRYNLLEPREPYETTGQVPNVVFPSGWIVEGTDADGFASPSGRVRLYYGAADTVVGLATGKVQGLLEACREGT
jgi:predicted GH43/DUF377 family glycosyl hydrolase